MYTGFQYATRSGSSIGVNDFVIPAAKAKSWPMPKPKLKEIESQFAYRSGDPGRKYNKVIDIWSPRQRTGRQSHDGQPG